MKERLFGVVLLLAFCMLGYISVYKPLESARTGAPTVSVSLKGAIFAPVCLIGLLYLGMGSRVTAILGTRENPSAAAYTIGIVAVLLGFGLYLWVRSTLQGYGYEFEGLF